MSVYVYSKQCLTLENAAPLPILLFSPGIAHGVIRLGKTAPCSPLCHFCLYVCKYVCARLISFVFVHVCQFFHHVVKSQLLIKPASLAERDPERVQEKREGYQEGSEQWVFSFVLITEAKIKISKAIAGWRKGNRNLGINREWVFAPAMQQALNCPAHETMLTFFCPLFFKFILQSLELY